MTYLEQLELYTYYNNKILKYGQKYKRNINFNVKIGQPYVDFYGQKCINIIQINKTVKGVVKKPLYLNDFDIFYYEGLSNIGKLCYVLRLGISEKELNIEIKKSCYNLENVLTIIRLFKYKMKARIFNIHFTRNELKTICEITFCDPYCNNMKRIVKGVAKCRPDDTFDETLGRRIAEGRAKRAMFQKLEQSAWNKSNKLAQESDIQAKRAIRETKHIQELLNNHYNEQQN